MNRQVAILGTVIDVVTMSDTLSMIESFLVDGECHQIATANTDFLVKALSDGELRTVLSQCDLVVPDGMPLLWASRLVGVPMAQRVTGADLVPRLAEISAAKGWRLFLLGGTPEASRRAELEMRRLYPSVNITGRLAPPPAPIDKMDNEAILEGIRRARPDILLVAFGNPKQEKWIHHHLRDLGVPVCIGVGAALDFIGGSVPRAPRWMQNSGLEWFHRLITEPRRLGRRYLVDAIQFSRCLVMQLVANGLPGANGKPLGIARYDFGDKTVLQIKGGFSRSQVKLFDEECNSAMKPGRCVIVDLAAASAIGADALAALMKLRRQASSVNARLILSGLTPRVERTLRLSQAGAQFHTVYGVVEALADAVSATAQMRLELAGDAVVCRLEGELSGSRAKVALEVCEQLSRTVSEVSFDTGGLSEASRSLFAALPLPAGSRKRAASAA
jgi:N-acetylglucosaminyldiphosphoundecaprenol N-acetyl-beta-D-mannosaminyltransferase